MDEKQTDIADMQCWLFRMAQKKWNITSEQCTAIFRKYHLLDFIADCYDLLHLSSYSCALEDIEQLLANQGVAL